MTPLVKVQPPAARRSATAKNAKKTSSRTAAQAKPARHPKPAARGAKRPASSKQKAKPPGTRASTRKAALARAQSRPRHGDPNQLLERIQKAIPDPHVELHFDDPWQLLVAVILSAQSTDRMVNLVTPEIFRRWPTPEALAAAPQEEVEVVVKSTGFFRNKAKAIRGASQMLVERFGSSVPRTLAELVEVPGVARKTANVVLGAAYGLSTGIVTDTHAMRVAQRLALTRFEVPEKIEADLCRLFPERHWIALSHQLVLHGRHLCTARAPNCKGCALNELCPARQAPPEGTWQERASAEANDMAERSFGFSRPLASASAS
jgi:endonuclease-3